MRRMRRRVVAAEGRRLGLTVVRERARGLTMAEAAWRDARWNFLYRVARAHRARVATAHTRDDQVETIFMRALRGVGRAWSRGTGGAVARRAALARRVAGGDRRAGPSARACPSWRIPSNATAQFLRGRVRHDLLPAHRGACARDFARSCWRSATAPPAGAARWSRCWTSLGPVTVRAGTLRIPAAPLEGTTEQGRAVLWQALFSRVGVALDARGTRELVRFTKCPAPWCHGYAGQGRRGASCRGARRRLLRAPARRGDGTSQRRLERAGRAAAGAARRLALSTVAAGAGGRGAVEVTRPTRISWEIGVSASAPVSVRLWRAGDRIRTAGARTGRRVTRYFAEAKVPALDRRGWPVVLVENELVWVPGICRSVAAPHRPGRPDLIWYRCEREHDAGGDRSAPRWARGQASGVRRRRRSRPASRELGAEITAAYPDGDLLVLGLLKGSFIFLSDLVRQIDRPLQVDFLVASRYGDAMVSSGIVRLLYDPETELEGKHILLVEDIVDSGRTLQPADRPARRAASRKSLEICALLHKHIADAPDASARGSSDSTPRTSSSSGTVWITPRTSGICRTSRACSRTHGRHACLHP